MGTASVCHFFGNLRGPSIQFLKSKFNTIGFHGGFEFGRYLVTMLVKDNLIAILGRGWRVIAHH